MTISLQSCYQYNGLRKHLQLKSGQIQEDDLMAKFNFGNVLGGSVFGGLNAILQHNASRDGYSKANRYEVVIGPAVQMVQNAEAGDSAQSGNLLSQLHGETARRISFRCESISMPGETFVLKSMVIYMPSA